MYRDKSIKERYLRNRSWIADDSRTRHFEYSVLFNFELRPKKWSFEKRAGAEVSTSVHFVHKMDVKGTYILCQPVLTFPIKAIQHN
jgi:hypothetical protein